MTRVYFDHNATTPISLEVLDKIYPIMSTPLNPSSIHYDGQVAKNLLETARKQIYKTFHVPKHYKIIFTSSATEANNLLIYNMNHKKVYSSTVEHYSVLKNDLYKLINVDKNGIIKFNELQDNLTAKDCFCCILAHNETGVIQPIQDIKRYLNGAFLHLDCVQVPGKLSLNIEELGADSISISGHKFGAPYGIGCLIYNAEKVKLNPMINGGGQEYGIRSGTEHVIGAYGLGIACEMLENRIEQMSQVIKIRDFIEDQIKQIYPQAIVLKGNRLPNTTSIYMPNASAETQVIYFDAQGYSVSAGSACSSGKIAHPYVFLAMGFEDKIASNIIRVSLGISNSFEEATGFVENWKKLYQHINKSS